MGTQTLIWARAVSAGTRGVDGGHEDAERRVRQRDPLITGPRRALPHSPGFRFYRHDPSLAAPGGRIRGGSGADPVAGSGINQPAPGNYLLDMN
jgi:hypothetical protein